MDTVAEHDKHAGRHDGGAGRGAYGFRYLGSAGAGDPFDDPSGVGKTDAEIQEAAQAGN